MAIGFLHLVERSNNKEVFFSQQEFIGGIQQYRVSPVFRVNALPFDFQALGTNFQIAFFFHRNPFQKIGQLRDILDPGELGCLWFCHGLATILAISNNSEEIEIISKAMNDEVMAFEMWNIHDAILTDIKTSYSPLVDCSGYNFNFVDYSGLDYDKRKILDEIRHTINIAISKAAQFFPGLLEMFVKIIECTNKIIQELLFLATRSGNQVFSCGIEKEIVADDDIRIRRIHQNTGLLVQLNSNLSYVVSQAFSGISPILENKCSTKSYSLLGIGQAFKAICSVASFVENVFSQYPVARVIDDFYSIAPEIDIFSEISNYDYKKWEGSSGLLDKEVVKLPPDLIKPKLVAYSGIQGFRESEFTVTVALQSLSHASSGRWSLLTLSHELMHAHVRSILASIFSSSDENIANSDVFKEQYEKFYELKKGGKVDRITLKDSLLFIIFNYCCNTRDIKIDEETGFVSINDVVPRDSSELRDFVVGEYKEINEVLTHVLDYYYFYNGKSDQYIGLLWSSWAPVPAVVENIENYLLRSLVTIATEESGTIFHRFSAAHSALIKILNGLSAKINDPSVINYASEFLSNKTTINYLQAVFMPYVYLADMAKYFLKTAHIHSSLMIDDNIDTKEDFITYNIENGEFPGFSIQSPIAFLHDRFCRSFGETYELLSREYLSCWQLMACASSCFNK